MTSPEEVRQALLKKFPELKDNIEILEDETNRSNYKIKINCLYRELYNQTKEFIANEKWISVNANDKVLSDIEYDWKLFERMNKIILTKTE